MKKRILSILLAALMVLATFVVIPTSVVAADTPSYSWNGFEASDVRTHKAAEGQVIDIGSKGEISKAPVLDGVISSGEYSISGDFAMLADASKKVKMHFAVKDGYLYIAADTVALFGTTRRAVQFDIGTASSPTSESTSNRMPINISADGVREAVHTPFTHITGGTAYAGGRTSVETSHLMVDYFSGAGVYEVKYDIGAVYKLFAAHAGGENTWNSPCMHLSFWVWDDSGAQHFSIPSTYKNGGRSVGWASYTLILPQSAYEYAVENYKGIIVEGKDFRNAFNGQMVTINDYATVAPDVTDGKVSAGEYTASGTFKGDNTKSYHGTVNTYYSVKDGWLYGAFVYADTSLTNNIALQAGLASNAGVMLYSRLSTTAKADGTMGGNGGMYKWINKPTAWMKDAGCPGYLGGGAGTFEGFQSAKATNDGTNTTIEFKVSIPAMVAALKDGGWNPAESNCVSMLLWADAQENNIGVLTSGNPDLLATVTKYSGFSTNPGYYTPTVQLPKGCTELYAPEKYFVDDIDSFEHLGQHHADTAPSVVTLDGVISAGEYTSSESYNKVRSKDSTVTPDVSISGTNYFAYDANYLYVGATVKDTFVAGKSAYQLNLSVPNNHVTGIFDLGDGVTRASAKFMLQEDGSVTVEDWGVVMRTQTCYDTGDNNTKYAGQSDFGDFVRANLKKAEVVASYDAEAGVITYEIKVELAGLAKCFGVEEVDTVSYINYVVLGDGTTAGYHLYKIPTDSHEYRMVRVQTALDNDRKLNYKNNFYGNIIDLNRDSSTKDSASIRLSAESKNSGLRFKSNYADKYLAEMAAYAESKGETMEIGTLIAPADYITGEFTHAALGAGNYVEVMASTATPYANANGVITIAGSLVNIKEGNLARDFAGRGFIKIGNEYFYTDNYTVRNVSDIATDALADKSATQTDVYKYQLSDGKFSPYAPGQITILEGLKSN